MDIPFGKPPQFPNRLPQKRYSVRENTPKPEPFAAKEIVRSGNHPNSRTNCPQRDTPFGKPPQNPNELPQKRYSVRKTTPIPEPTAPKEIVRSGNHSNSRTVRRKKDTPFGKTYHIPNGVLFLVWGGPYGGTTFQGWALLGHHLSGEGLVGHHLSGLGPWGVTTQTARLLGRGRTFRLCG